MAVRNEQSKKELAEHSPRPSEYLLLYQSLKTAWPQYHSLWQEVGDVGLWRAGGLNTRDVETKYAVALDALGPLGADHFLFWYLERRLLDMQRTHTSASALTLLATENGPVNLPSHSHSADYQHLTKILEQRKPTFAAETDTIDSSLLSEKVSKLIWYLTKRRDDTFHGIVFVEQRHVTAALAWILSKSTDLQPWLKCAPFVGHGMSSTSDHLNLSSLGPRGMSAKLQSGVVNQFRQGELNLLVATSVAEEGLDFQVRPDDESFSSTESLTLPPPYRHAISSFASTVSNTWLATSNPVVEHADQTPPTSS